MAKWYLKTMDRNSKPTVIPFDKVERDSPLILGLDVKRFLNTFNLSKPTEIMIKRPTDKQQRELLTYIGKDENGNLRTWIDIAHHPKTTVKSIMATETKRNTLNKVKKTHRFKHASSIHMVNLLKTAGYNDEKLTEVCENVYKSCDVCAFSDTPYHMKKVSIFYVSE